MIKLVKEQVQPSQSKTEQLKKRLNASKRMLENASLAIDGQGIPVEFDEATVNRFIEALLELAEWLCIRYVYSE